MIVSEDFWKRIRKIQGIHQRLYAHGLGWLVGWIILLLEHTGRKSGKRYFTPMQYEKINGTYFVGAGRGPKADWYQNLLFNNRVHVRVGRIQFDGWAEPIREIPRVAEFLEYRLKKHPVMIGLIMKMHRLPFHPDPRQLEQLAETLAIVALHPDNTNSKENLAT